MFLGAGHELFLGAVAATIHGVAAAVGRGDAGENRDHQKTECGENGNKNEKSIHNNLGALAGTLRGGMLRNPDAQIGSATELRKGKEMARVRVITLSIISRQMNFINRQRRKRWRNI